ncbi:Protein phosphatase 2C family protein [Rhynchospora pubera]|uniref:protein-serine/threonine phosphatase n=1 Tax=Rhynchospora pubera TaxID=906938 RepID=A0AAV8EXV2_9POAL|nr:Protein phosphatase 2C family protein [Rhynchospora pubera]
MEAKTGDITVPLAVLLKREMSNEKSEKPDLLHGQASQKKKGEDFTLLIAECERTQETGTTSSSVFGLFDGHNGSAAAIYTKEHLVNNVLNAIPPNVSHDDWTSALPRALVAGFVKTDKDFTVQARSSGTTVTLVIIDGWVVTVASVGDSCFILESAEGSIYVLSADHRLEVNEEEVERVTASGGEAARINIAGGAAQVTVYGTPSDMKRHSIVAEAYQLNQLLLALLSKVKGLRDGTTCIVVDILPPEEEEHIDRGFSDPNVVEEMFEDGSAMLSERCKILDGF